MNTALETASGTKAYVWRHVQGALSAEPGVRRYTTRCRIPVWPIFITDPIVDLYLGPTISLPVQKSILEEAGYTSGQLVNLRFNITTDHKRHPDPWISVPDVGLYENFGTASSMAICIEAYDQTANAWAVTRLYCTDPLDGNDVDGTHLPKGWLKAMNVIQLLEGIEYTSTSAHFTHQYHPVASMKYIDYDQSEGTVSYIDMPRPRYRRQLPPLANFDDNAKLMTQRYPGLMAASKSVSMTPNTNPSPDPDEAGALRAQQCDLCWWIVHRTNLVIETCYSPTSSSSAAAGSSSLASSSSSSAAAAAAAAEGGNESCNNCKRFLNRPCTWTLAMRRGSIADWLTREDTLSLWPQLPHRDVDGEAVPFTLIIPKELDAEDRFIEEPGLDMPLGASDGS